MSAKFNIFAPSQFQTNENMNTQEINNLNDLFLKHDAKAVLMKCAEIFSGRIAFASSLGYEDQVITHIIAENKIPTRIFTLDTGRLFPESYELISKTNARYKNILQVYFPDHKQVEEMVNAKGINLFYESIENRKLCCGVRKTEPLKRALEGLDAWVTGLRKSQSVTRSDLKIVEWDGMHKLIKINPLLNWSEDEVRNYIRDHKIPYNVLHDKGFPSIGCQPCTRAIQEGEDIRAGRWWWELPEQKECGLHK
jgi:phosphoadenosine phosphosulfate reductase